MNFRAPVLFPRKLACVFCSLALLAGCSIFQGPVQPLGPEAAGSGDAASETTAPPAPVGDVALLLPFSGPYAAIAEQVRAGARAGVQALLERGVEIRLAEIDTNSEGWVKQLEELPPSYTVVGGPLRPNVFEEITMTDAYRKRIFFTFIQGLGGATEGRDAWRFFSSPDDQIRTLLQAARKDFGIDNVGILYPDEPFGKRIAQLFMDNAHGQGITVGAMQAYPPEDPLQWSEIVANLLYSAGQRAPIQAVFLPDVWSKAEMLVPYFFYHQREDLLLMGSTLWGQTLSEDLNVDVHSFRLAMFPGVWWEDSGAPAATRLRRLLAAEEKPGLWTALGYDFVRFAGRLGSLPEGWDAALVNRRIQQAQSMEWSMAPIYWNQVGVARQEMFLFTPSENGMQPADLQRMRQRRQAVLSRIQ